jgi:hypothetical protein
MLKEKQNNLVKEYGKNKNKADILYSKARKEFPLEYVPQYFVIKVDSSIYSHLRNLIPLAIKLTNTDKVEYLIPVYNLKTFLEDNYNFEEPLTNGALILLSRRPHSQSIFIYIHAHDNRLYGDYQIISVEESAYWSDLPATLRYIFPLTDDGHKRFKKAYPEQPITWEIE